jgi:pimeloyl-ACP methyl ester carboxylesterase
VWAAERAALERGDVEAALHVVVDAWLGPDASPEARERVRDMQRHTYEVQGDAEPEEVEDPLDEHPERLAELRTPTLIVAGELDFVDYREGARAMADAIPGAAHQELPSLGHLFPLERPHEFRTRLIAFLRSLDPDAGLSRPGADSPRA